VSAAPEHAPAAAPAGRRAPPRHDVEAVRADFPGLHQEVHGRPLVYLDNSATTQKPRAVIDAVRHHYERDCSNVHRGVHVLSSRATAAFEGAREKVRRFLDASSERECVFVRGTTEAINLVAQSFVRPRVGPGDEILITWMEHHSNIVPWQMACQQTGATLKVLPITDDGELELARLPEMLTDRTRFVSLAHVSNALGTINPVTGIVREAHDRGIPVLLDGAQAVPHLQVDVRAIGCDFYAFSGHKVYGPTGVGVLWGREELLREMPPWQGGGDMILSVSFERTVYNELPYKFEAGTPNVAGAVGLGTALDYVARLGVASIVAHEKGLLARATERVLAIPGARVIGEAALKAGVLSFVVEGVHPHDVGTILDQHGVAIRTGHHCAEPLMRRYGVPATARASFGIYNTLDEIDVFGDALAECVEMFRG
jgi:cysteine desulfurase/selenocysteine lyase